MPSKPPTAAQKKRWMKILEMGCIVQEMHQCGPRPTIHHCGTGAGGRKNHDKVICLCWNMHVGPVGIDGQQMAKSVWQAIHGSEEALLRRTEKLLNEHR